jgi:hypothetical protein
VRVLLENAGHCTRRIATWRITRLLQVAATRIEACAIDLGELGSRTPRDIKRLHTAFELLAALGCMAAQQRRWRDAVGHFRVVCRPRVWQALCPVAAHRAASLAVADAGDVSSRRRKTAGKRRGRTGIVANSRSKLLRRKGDAEPPEADGQETATATDEEEEEARVRRMLVVLLADATVHYLDALHAIGAHREMLAVAQFSKTLPARIRVIHNLRGYPGDGDGDANGDRLWPMCATWYRRVSERLAAAQWWVAYRRGDPGTEPPQGRPEFSTRHVADGGGAGDIGDAGDGARVTKACGVEALGGPATGEGRAFVSPLIRSVCAAFARLDRAAASEAALREAASEAALREAVVR